MNEAQNTTHHPAIDNETHFDAVIVGAGFAGMYMLHKLRELGFTAKVYEAGRNVGGTWYWNRYPGRCQLICIDTISRDRNEVGSLILSLRRPGLES